MILVQANIREDDCQGSGHFGAPRGDKTHRGVDIACIKSSGVLSLCSGIVTKIGFPYSQIDPDKVARSKVDKHIKKRALRYVEVLREDGFRFRYLYISPCVKAGDHVIKNQLLGNTQGLTDIYIGITDHFHFEIIGKNGDYFNPSGIVNFNENIN